MPSPGCATSVPHGLLAVSVAAWRSEILICLRMNVRSLAVTVKPLPTGATAALAGAAKGVVKGLVSATTTAAAATAGTLRRFAIVPWVPGADVAPEVVVSVAAVLKGRMGLSDLRGPPPPEGSESRLP